jgi:hypothetical protein
MDASLDIIGVRVPALYRQYGASAETEKNVIVMLDAALDCLTRATELSVGHEPTHTAMLRRVEMMRAHISDHQAELQAWRQVPILIAMDEAENATKH